MLSSKGPELLAGEIMVLERHGVQVYIDEVALRPLHEHRNR